MLSSIPWPQFSSLRTRLFVAFAGVLLLSLALTAASFWVQIRIYDTQQVQSDLQASAPSVFITVKHVLVQYWRDPRPGTTSARLAGLRAKLATPARTAGVRVLLLDYCDHVPVDTNSSARLVSLPAGQVPSTCSAVLDDMASGATQPRIINIAIGSDRVRQTSSLPGAGTSFYVAYTASAILAHAPIQGKTTPLLVRTIIIAKTGAGIDQQALSNILPRLAAAGIFAVLLTLLVVALIVRAITRPLRTITAASERMARGDYSQRVPEAREDEVGQLARSFNRMATEVGNAREMQRQFIANVSHDLKTPLTSILGFSQILADRDGQEATPIQQRAVHVINEEARRLQRLTFDLLDLSRLEAGQLQLQHTTCDLNDLAGRALTRYAELPANAGLHFHDDRVAGSLVVWGDPDRLMQVLVNLLDNAVKFCHEGGSIALRTARQGEDVVLVVANTGIGIATEDLTRVFQRFYRTDHSRATRTGGTGLGLAIVREIVAAHGGRVEARSEQDGWTRFIVTLPAVADDVYDRGSTHAHQTGGTHLLV